MYWSSASIPGSSKKLLERLDIVGRGVGVRSFMLVSSSFSKTVRGRPFWGAVWLLLGVYWLLLFGKEFSKNRARHL